MNNYTKIRYHKRIAKAIEDLGGKCINCGSVKQLEFDHIDPTTKAFTISNAVAMFGEDEIQKELKKCQLLCKECHKEKHSSKNKHGTLSAYRYCKCDLCKKAKSEYMKRYKQITGRYSSIGRATHL